MDYKHCEHCEKKHMEMDCCMEHSKSKEHLENKKAMLEKKLAWINEELAKAK